MRHEQKTWLVAYDIANPRRLRRVHRTLRREGMAAQYSAFTVEADDDGIEALLARVESIIDAAADDVRAYHLPARCTVWRMGRQGWPDGVTLTAHAAAVMLVDTAGAQDLEADFEAVEEDVSSAS